MIFADWIFGLCEIKAETIFLEQLWATFRPMLSFFFCNDLF